VCAAGLAAVLSGIAAARAIVAHGPVKFPAGTPGAAGDTTADFVAGQFSFYQGAANQIDGRGLWLTLIYGSRMYPSRLRLVPVGCNRPCFCA